MASYKILDIPKLGKPRTVTEWSKHPRCSVPHITVWHRLRRGWDPYDAVVLPRWGLCSRRETKKQRTLDGQVDRAIVAMGGDLADRKLRKRLEGVSRQRRHQLECD